MRVDVAGLGDRRHHDGVSFALGFSEDAIPYVTIGVLVLIGIVLTVSPVVYQTVEKIQFFMVALIVLFIVYAAFALLGGDGYAALGRASSRWTRSLTRSTASAPRPCWVPSRSPAPAA